MKVRLTLTGTAPLLMHNVRLANPMDPIARQMKAISGKRKKTDQDHADLADLEWVGGLYWDAEVGPYLPGANIEKSIVEGGRITKQGKQIERGLFVVDNVCPLIYSGPRALDALKADANFRSALAVKVGQSRVIRTRPMFTQWAVEADATVDPGLLSLDVLQGICDDAGSMAGIGDYRPRYGRYDVRIEAM